MGELTFWDKIEITIREFIGSIGLKLFLWSIRMDEKEYISHTFHTFLAGMTPGILGALCFIIGLFVCFVGKTDRDSVFAVTMICGAVVIWCLWLKPWDWKS